MPRDGVGPHQDIVKYMGLGRRRLRDPRDALRQAPAAHVVAYASCLEGISTGPGARFELKGPGIAELPGQWLATRLRGRRKDPSWRAPDPPGLFASPKRSTNAKSPPRRSAGDASLPAARKRAAALDPGVT